MVWIHFQVSAVFEELVFFGINIIHGICDLAAVPLAKARSVGDVLGGARMTLGSHAAAGTAMTRGGIGPRL